MAGLKIKYRVIRALAKRHREQTATIEAAKSVSAVLKRVPKRL